ncbi:aldose 1-epimerase family protein [Corynebacterium sp. TAE3-ERU12]|uniref:aldose 1-epimerase family protein n=1 Tax=Corynebacterium sp. TAE3-ERU12 TaxID=2849491 RepID=UPI001C464E30|nr:aldose 1-epimerase family protein [Corynebacterium sp. TAE3-ERU12]MBV7295256.1 aldose 1-epimerase family protein [Corynebacterium sp. TAE3-ERU12]
MYEDPGPRTMLCAGDYQAWIGEVGGGPRSLRYQGQPLLAEYPEAAAPPLDAGILLAPWPNRTRDGEYTFAGQKHRLVVTEPPRHTAIHGFTGRMAWSPAQPGDADPATVIRRRLHIPEQPGWPWPLELTADWSLDPEQGLCGELSVTNRAEQACPLGVGWHPYLVARGAALDECTLQAPVASALPLDERRNLPSGPEEPAGTVLEPVGGRSVAEGWSVPMSGTWLDHCFGGLPAAEDGWSRAQLRGPDGAVELRAGGDFRWWQIYTADPNRGEGFPGLGRAVAVEPMSCPPDALNSGRDLLVVEPGQTRQFRVGVRAVD